MPRSPLPEHHADHELAAVPSPRPPRAPGPPPYPVARRRRATAIQFLEMLERLDRLDRLDRLQEHAAAQAPRRIAQDPAIERARRAHPAGSGLVDAGDPGFPVDPIRRPIGSHLRLV